MAFCLTEIHGGLVEKLAGSRRVDNRESEKEMGGHFR